MALTSHCSLLFLVPSPGEETGLQISVRVPGSWDCFACLT